FGAVWQSLPDSGGGRTFVHEYYGHVFSAARRLAAHAACPRESTELESLPGRVQRHAPWTDALAIFCFHVCLQHVHIGLRPFRRTAIRLQCCSFWSERGWVRLCVLGAGGSPDSGRRDWGVGKNTR